mmetsp:Transcript_9843/g.14798  ORF Transcript_9843/g.14798 Transcript_9843/m.14798 type:complete len:237 (+) Transcript_9843:74-784(+)
MPPSRLVFERRHWMDTEPRKEMKVDTHASSWPLLPSEMDRMEIEQPRMEGKTYLLEEKRVPMQRRELSKPRTPETLVFPTASSEGDEMDVKVAAEPPPFEKLLLSTGSAKISNRKRHACRVCNKTFTHKGSLATHMRIHTGFKPHQCKHCGKRFTQSGNLATHVRTHTKEKPFKCNQCEKAFSHKSNLNSHMQIHSGIRPFKCLQCGKGFSRKNRIVSHMKTHLQQSRFMSSRTQK